MLRIQLNNGPEGSGKLDLGPFSRTQLDYPELRAYKPLALEPLITPLLIQHKPERGGWVYVREDGREETFPTMVIYEDNWA